MRDSLGLDHGRARRSPVKWTCALCKRETGERVPAVGARAGRMLCAPHLERERARDNRAGGGA